MEIDYNSNHQLMEATLVAEKFYFDLYSAIKNVELPEIDTFGCDEIIDMLLDKLELEMADMRGQINHYYSESGGVL